MDAYEYRQMLERRYDGPIPKEELAIWERMKQDERMNESALKHTKGALDEIMKAVR